MLTVTGVYLMFFYVPSATQAYTNILDIQSQVTFGLLTRNIHRWAAHLMVFFVFLHMMRVFYHGAYKPPREFNWVVGVVLLFLTIMLSFTGYLLPWDQIAYWAITIGTNMGGYAPLFNTPTKLMLLGGLEVGQNTLLRFYVLHIMVFPLVAAIFLAVHFWRIRKDGGISGPAMSRRRRRRPRRDARRPAGRSDPADGDRQAARADVGAAVPAARAGQAGRRRPGPEGTRRHGHDLAAPARRSSSWRPAMMSIFLLLMGLFINAPLEELANGNVTPAVAKAPWYFLGLQELLAYFHPTVAGVLVPTFVLVGRGAHPVHRPREHPRHPPVGAQDRGRAVHAVLRPRPDR